MHMLKAISVLAVMLSVAIPTGGTAGSHNDEQQPVWEQKVARVGVATQISNFTFSPQTFRLGQPVKMSFDYVGVPGGLTNANVRLEYKGSAARHSRKSSIHASAIWGTKESGTFRGDLSIFPTDDPPFKITYFLKVGKSKWVSATVNYEAGIYVRSGTTAEPTAVAGVDESVAARLAEGSPWSGKWKVPGGGPKGRLQLVFENNAEGVTARIQNGTGAQYSFNGPVSELEIDGNTVSFKAITGAPYKLKLEDGKLEGTVRGGVVKVKLKPATL